MLSRLHAHLTFSNVVACLALFIALGSTSYAAIVITGTNVKDSSLTGRDIRNRSLTSSDFAGPLTGPRGPAGPAGQNGSTGGQGPAGPAGQNATGTKGETGATGAKGDAGATGANGDTGATGADGATGPAGAVGPSASAAAERTTSLSMNDGTSSEVLSASIVAPAGTAALVITADLNWFPMSSSGAALHCHITLDGSQVGAYKDASTAAQSWHSQAMTKRGIAGPGTHSVALVCRAFSATVVTDRANLTVIATGG